MTYRKGVWVFDRSNGRVGKVLREVGGRVLLVDSVGNDWTAGASGLRLATGGEREMAAPVLRHGGDPHDTRRIPQPTRPSNGTIRPGSVAR